MLPHFSRGATKLLLLLLPQVAGYWSSWYPVARDDPEMLQFLGLSPETGDKCLGLYVTGKASPEWNCRPGSRKPWQEKVDWRQ
jgi:hypothetical protein